MTFFSRSHPAGDVAESGGVTLISSGRNYPLFNVALLNSMVDAGDGDLAGRISRAQDYFGQRNHGWSFWVCQDLLVRHIQKKSKALFMGRGMWRALEPPGMVLRRLHPVARPLPALVFRRVEDAATRIAFSHITSVVFELPLSVTRGIYDHPDAWQPDYMGYVGFLADRAVTSVMVVPAEGSAGIYSLATMPDLQHRGYGEATMRFALAQARSQTGLELSVLQSSYVGLNLYRRLGYEQVTRFIVYRSQTR